MAALGRAASCQAGAAQWRAACSGLLQTATVQGQCRRMLCGILQRHKTAQFQPPKPYGGLIQANGAVTQQARSFYNTNKDSLIAFGCSAGIGRMNCVPLPVGWTKRSLLKFSSPYPELVQADLQKNDRRSAKDSLQPSEEKVGAFTRIIEAMGFTGPLKYSRWKIKVAALRMYTCCVEKTDYEEFFNSVKLFVGSLTPCDQNEFFRENRLQDFWTCCSDVVMLRRCHMPDTLNSWFLVAQLHVWMCLVRMKQEGRTGKYMCRYIVHCMWEDVEQRGKVMGINSAVLKEDLRSMVENFYAALFGYDEGILSDDHVLAAALWRNLFNKNCEDPRHLELLVEYVRKQVQHLDALSGEDLLLTGEVSWRPLVESDARSILKPLSPVYNDEGL